MNDEQNSFGHWLSGFTDGEGCFSLEYVSNCPTGSFNIVLRDDDIDILRSIQSFLGCGNITGMNLKQRAGNPLAKFKVTNACDLATKVVPNFEMFPLRAKKQRDFEIWKQAIQLMWLIKQSPRVVCYTRWSQEDRNQFRKYFEELRSIRKYKSVV